MPLGLTTLTTFLSYFGGHKVQSSSDSTHRPHRPNIFAHRNPRVVRSRSARLHAAKSAAKHRQQRSNASTGTARRAKMRPLTGNKPLRRCDTVLVPQPPTHPQPPGAFVTEPSFVVPGFPELDHRNLPPFVVLKLVFDALDGGRQVLLRAEEERNARVEEAKRAHRLEQCSKKALALAAHRKEVEKEYAKLLEENWRRAEAARRRAEHEALAHFLQESMRKAQEAQRQAMEERRRQAEQERKRREEERREEERREAERREREHREDERRERERLEREAAQSNLIARLRVYEAKWAVLRSNDVRVENLIFHDIPWPSFEDVRSVGDITEERVLAFVHHLHEYTIPRPAGGLAKSIRLEKLRWHPDKFEANIPGIVVGCDREAVKEAAGHVARILNINLNSLLSFASCLRLVHHKDFSWGV